MKGEICAVILMVVSLGCAESEEKTTVRLEDALLKVRYIHYGLRYSFAVTAVQNTRSRTWAQGVSFDSRRLKAGRLHPSGIWQELSRPFSYRAGSEVYNSETAMRKNFENDAAGAWGLSFFLLPKLFLSSIVLPDPWAALGTVVVFSDAVSLLLLFRGDEGKPRTSRGWVEDAPLPFSPTSFHSGGELQAAFGTCSIKTLFMVSGNPYFRSGVLVRSIFKTAAPLWEARALVVYAGKDFMLPSGECIGKKLLGSGTVTVSPFSWVSVTADGRYRIDRDQTYPALYTGSSYETGLSGELKEGPAVMEVKGTASTAVAPSGAIDTRYTLKGGLRMEGPLLSGTVSFLEKGEGGHPFSRKGTLQLRWKGKGLSVSTAFSVVKDLYASVLLHTEGGIKMVLNTGKAALSLSYRGRTSPGETHLTIGFESRCCYKPRKKRAVSK